MSENQVVNSETITVAILPYADKVLRLVEAWVAPETR